MTYALDNNIATLTFDDGKANVVGPAFLDDINAGLDRAQEEKAGAVILRGRDRVFRLHVWAGTRMWDQMARSNPEVRFCPCWCCWERGEPRKPTPKYPVRAPNPNSAKARLFRRALGRPEFVDPDPKRARTSASGGKDG